MGVGDVGMVARDAGRGARVARRTIRGRRVLRIALSALRADRFQVLLLHVALTKLGTRRVLRWMSLNLFLRIHTFETELQQFPEPLDRQLKVSVIHPLSRQPSAELWINDYERLDAVMDVIVSQLHELIVLYCTRQISSPRNSCSVCVES